MGEVNKEQALALRFKDIEEGRIAKIERLLTQEDVDSFAALTGDFNPLHTDADYASGTLFGKPIVHGMLTGSFVSRLIGMFLPGRYALWTSQRMAFLEPAYVGDLLMISGKVRKVSPVTGMIMIEISILNQAGRKLIEGSAEVKLLDYEPGEDAREKPYLIENHDTVEIPQKPVATKAVVVTGGSGGIGSAVCRALAEKNYPIVVQYRSETASADRVVSQIIQRGGRAIAFKADISVEEEVDALFLGAREAFGGVTGLVHAAAPSLRLIPLESIEWSDFSEQLDVQVKGAFNCFRAMKQDLAEAGSGCVVFLGTTAADNVPPLQQAAYVAAKSALTSFAKSWAAEMGHCGVRVNIVAAGMTHTRMTAEFPEKARMLAKVQAPLRRLAEPEDIAAVVSFLFSAGARHVTGETIRVCGGSTML